MPSTLISQSQTTNQTWQQAVPDIAWGTITLFIAVLSGYLTTITLALQGELSYLGACLICSYLAYASFTIVHDAGHGSIIVSTNRYKKLEKVIGWLASIPLLVTSFTFFKLMHDRHHAHTNHPELDPDHIYNDSNFVMLLISIYYIPIQYYVKFFTVYKNDPLCRQSHFSTFTYLILLHGSLITLAIIGYPLEVLCFGYIPMLIALFALVFFFDYLPHHPHQSTDSFHNTRVYPSKIINLLLLGQNYHLVHHLYPKVPWYRYQQAFYLVKPELERQQSPIEPINQLLSHHNIGAILNQGQRVDGILKVKSITQLNHQAKAINFAIDTPLQFKAGQYLVISKWLNGQQHSRCYSICSTPKDNQLTIAVKQIDNGIMSTYLNQQLQPDDELLVKGPFGDFYYQPNKSANPLVLIAAGSGITPILSIAKTALTTKQKVHLIYFNHNLATTMFYQQLNELVAKHPDLLDINHYWRENQPRANQKQLAQLIPLTTSGQSHFYLCGPQSLMTQVIDYLKQNGIDSHQIHTEQFKQPEGNTANKGQLHPVKLITSGQKHQIQVSENQTLVQAALQQNIPINHACNNGTCGSCKCQLIKGQIKTPSQNTSILSTQDKAAGFILACQTQPSSGLEVRFES